MAREAVIIAGPNGTGKSTLAHPYQGLTGFPFISADLIAAEISPDDPLAVRIDAGRRFSVALSDLIARGESFIAETTLSGRAFQDVFHQLRAYDFEIRVAFIFLDTPDLCLKRVRQRVMRGGHDVPEEDVRRRFYRSKRNFWKKYRLLADQWYLYYNAGASLEEVAFGTSGSETVIDEALFEVFKQDVE